MRKPTLFGAILRIFSNFVYPLGQGVKLVRRFCGQGRGQFFANVLCFIMAVAKN